MWKDMFFYFFCFLLQDIYLRTQEVPASIQVTPAVIQMDHTPAEVNRSSRNGRPIRPAISTTPFTREKNASPTPLSTPRTT